METQFDALSPEEVEDVFVEAFVLPKMRERIKFELRSRKKRERFFSRLSQGPEGASSVLMAEFMSQAPQFAVAREADEMRAWLKANGAGPSCYLMSYLKEIDGHRFSLGDAVVRFLGCSMEVVMICSERLALIQAESFSGTPPRFLLKRSPGNTAR